MRNVADYEQALYSSDAIYRSSHDREIALAKFGRSADAQRAIPPAR